MVHILKVMTSTWASSQSRNKVKRKKPTSTRYKINFLMAKEIEPYENMKNLELMLPAPSAPGLQWRYGC